MDSEHFAIVLAAGFSRRMGQCKASLKWHHDESFLQYQVSQFCQAGFSPFVVLGSHNINLQKEVFSDCKIVINDAPERGKTSSILTALNCLPESFLSVTISAVDQPRPAYVYEQLLHSHLLENASITCPIHNERLGHPLIFSKDMLTHLRAITEETQGLRAILAQFWTIINRVVFTDPLVLSDFNTSELYESMFFKIVWTRTALFRHVEL